MVLRLKTDSFQLPIELRYFVDRSANAWSAATKNVQRRAKVSLFWRLYPAYNDMGRRNWRRHLIPPMWPLWEAIMAIQSLLRSRGAISALAIIAAVAPAAHAQQPTPEISQQLTPADTTPQKVRTALDILKMKAMRLGAASIRGDDTVADKVVPALFFGTTKMNNYFALVDEVQKEAGGTATFFVKSGDQFVRVATNVRKDDGSRAIGTMLDPKGKAIAAVRNNEAYYGEADILGKTYTTGYEPIRNPDNNITGIFYVGYKKDE